MTLLVWIHLIQPHICLVLHEQLQKFDMSIYDFDMKRSHESLPINANQLPSKSNFLVPIIETKPGDPNPKTGIISGFLSVKVQNFARLFCHSDNAALLTSIREQQEDPSDSSATKSFPFQSVICACNSCLRCYEFNANTKSRKSVANSLETSVSIERPIRFRANFSFYTQQVSFMDALDLKAADERVPEESSIKTSESPESSSVISQILFDLNIRLATAQVIFLLEICDTPDLSEHINFHACLNSMNVYLNKSNELLCNKRKISILKEYLSSRPEHTASESVAVNCGRVVLNDFQCRFHITKPRDVGGSDYMSFFGPVTLKLDLSYNAVENELYSVVLVDSFSLTVNRYLLDILGRMGRFIGHHLADSTGSPVIVNDQKSSSVEAEEPPIPFVIHNDDIRGGKLQYTIVDNKSVKQILKNLNIGSETFTNLALLSHIRLPQVNEIVCVDDLHLNTDKLAAKVVASFGSHVSWRYAKRRALVELKIFPLPLVSADNDSANGELLCFLEYFNECVKKFVLLKQFTIKEGVQTNVIERQHKLAFGNGLTFARCWRIRLSSQAKRYIYASSLLASTKVDSVELQTTKLLQENRPPLYSQLEVNVSNVDCKLNIDYCEYKFLTMRPLIDLFQFKANSLIEPRQNPKGSLQLQADTINFLISQSSLVTLKHLINEWSVNNKRDQKLPHFYRLYNRTNMPLNLKQFDTEETCPMKVGTHVPYTWRTHKKPQLIQLFIPKYFVSSQAFRINQMVTRRSDCVSRTQMNAS